jgi:uncharacterized protein (TIGR00369 family)
MANIEAIRRMLTESVPFSRVLGVQVMSVGSGQALALLSESPERLNHVGTVHAVAQFGLAETTSGALLVSTFDDLAAEGFVPVAADVAIHYRRPARGDLRGTARLSEEEQARIRSDVAQTGRARVPMAVALTDADGNVTTECEVTWVLLKPAQV